MCVYIYITIIIMRDLSYIGSEREMAGVGKRYLIYYKSNISMENRNGHDGRGGKVGPEYLPVFSPGEIK